jgi:hypothetical protein
MKYCIAKTDTIYYTKITIHKGNDKGFKLKLNMNQHKCLDKWNHQNIQSNYLKIFD